MIKATWSRKVLPAALIEVQSSFYLSGLLKIKVKVKGQPIEKVKTVENKSESKFKVKLKEEVKLNFVKCSPHIGAIKQPCLIDQNR